MASSKTADKVEVIPPGALAQQQRKEAVIAAAQAAMAEMKGSTDFDPELLLVQIMEAASIDDMLDNPVLHLKDIVGTPMTVNSAQLQDSKFAESILPAYAVMHVTFDDSSTGVVTTGATQVVTILVAAQAKGLYPFRCSSTMIQSSNGNDVIKLTKAPDASF